MQNMADDSLIENIKTKIVIKFHFYKFHDLSSKFYGNFQCVIWYGEQRSAVISNHLVN